MLTGLGAAWARADFAPLRAALAGPVEGSPPLRRLAVRLGPPALRAGLSINPMSGAVLRGAETVRPGAGPSDWLVQAFGSAARHPLAVPLWHGPRADAATLVLEALPRAVALDRDPEAGEAVAVIGLALGRLNATQEALAAGVFGARAVRVQGWDRVIRVERALAPPAPEPEDIAAVAARLREAFPGAEGAGGLFLGPEAARPPRWRGASADPDAEALADWIPRLAAARRILAAEARLAALAAAIGAQAKLGLLALGEASPEATSVAALRNEMVTADAAAAWLEAA